MSSDAAAKGPRRNIRIGKYEVLSHIASGGMGAVYKARDTESNQEVALKVLSPEMAAKPAMVERFRREAKHASKLRHENIVSLYEFGEAHHTHFLVMEFIDGIDLHEYSNRQGPLDPDEALEIIIQGCRALDHSYRQGVIHRDIKPSNFLVTRQGERTVVKLTDLGLAREASNEEFRVTRAGTTIGTLDYMSPEQARDSGLADIRSDLYSLGCTWYHLLTGHAPFPKGGLGERLHRIMHEEPANVRQSNPRISADMASLVHRLMAKRPSDRPQTPADLLRQLEALKRGESLLTPRQALEILAQEEGGPVEPPKKNRRSQDGRRTPPSLPDSGAVAPRRPSDSRSESATPARTRSRTKSGKSTAELPIKSGKSTAEVPVRSGKSTAETPSADAAESIPPYVWYGVGGAAAIIFLVTVAVVLSLRSRHRNNVAPERPTFVADSRSESAGRGGTTATVAPALPPPPPNPLPQQTPKADNKPVAHSENPVAHTENPVAPKKPKWSALYQPSASLDAAALRKEIEAPWAKELPSGPAVALIVGRLPSSETTFRSLADACKAIPAGATGIIELRDNGPFFDIPVSIADRSLVVRAAAGYHPLLVWDVQRMLDEQRRNRDRRDAAPAAPAVFLDVKRGNLTLQDLHLAFKWPDAPSARTAVLSVEDGDLTVRGCTFSVAGKPRDGVTLARFTSAGWRVEGGGNISPSTLHPPSSTLHPMRRCRFERCYARGAKMAVLDANAPGAPILFESCLFVGDDAPLLRVGVANDRPTQLRAVRSTMICGKNLLELRQASPKDQDPAFDWLGWDVLLSRKDPEFGGELLRLDGNMSTQHLRWRAINCLYAGWGKLLAGSTTIAATDLAAWRRLWDRSEGDEVQADPWPTAVFSEPAQVPAKTYRTDGSHVAFAASSDANQPLGCDLDRLPPARDNWLSLTFERYAIQVPALPDDSGPPEIPNAGDGMFYGARVDLNQTDLGAYLQTVQKSYRLAPEIVLRLSGNGERLTTPVRIKGSSLVLYFEPPPETKEGEKSEPLFLAPAGRSAAEALLEVEQGNLSIINGNLRFSDKGEARVVPWLIKIHGGDLRLLHTHLEVPPRDSGAVFRGLIALDGSGDTAAERVRTCVANESVLVSAREAIAVTGIGARVLLAQTLLIAGDDAIHLTLDPDFTRKAGEHGGSGKANVQFLLDHATVSARGAVLHLSDVKQAGPPTEPVFLQSHDCGFVNLFSGRLHRPSLVRYDGEALAHGLLVWQSENDAFDRRLWFGAVSSTGPLPEKPEDHASWMGLWGSPGLRRARLDLPQIHTFDGERWFLERLAGWKFPGANLDKLGLPRKPISKTPR
ncbi:MAG TPA: serine/threonine-protein kinase [Gemmataceae bacterium]|nr:serine/threonine-protein kinase [Gemmataceae bacterium]